MNCPICNNQLVRLTKSIRYFVCLKCGYNGGKPLEV